MQVLMTGVDKNRLGGMWTVSNNYIMSEEYNKNVNLKYVATSTNGSKFKRVCIMLKGFKQIKKELKNNKYDLVHIHMAEKGSVFRAAHIVKMASKYKVKILIHMHAGPFMDWFSSLKSYQKNRIIKMFDKTSKILVLGQYWKTQLSKLIDENKIEVLYNGVNIPQKNNYNCTSKNIIYMGVLKKEKGIYDLINAIKIINTKLDKTIKFKFCGVDLEGDISKKIKELKLEDRIELLGWIDGEEKEKIMKDAMISILPSYFEALSMTIIEAMSYGIPVITTNISTMEEIIGNNKYLIEPGNVNELSNKILELVNDDKLREEISKKHYKRVNAIFSLNNNVKNTLKIYEELI